jgi:hypothetical protein
MIDQDDQQFHALVPSVRTIFLPSAPFNPRRISPAVSFSAALTPSPSRN